MDVGALRACCFPADLADTKLAFTVGKWVKRITRVIGPVVIIIDAPIMASGICQQEGLHTVLGLWLPWPTFNILFYIIPSRTTCFKLHRACILLLRC
jgi:hypothetical protein